MPPPDTKNRLLDAAERLFAEHGYDATTLRAITGEAEANLAAAHYHFGSKDGLFRAVLERRVADVNAERIARLDQLEARGPQAPPTLEELLEAFLEPALARAERGDEGWHQFMKLVGKLFSSPGSHHEKARAVFQEVLERYAPAFLRAVPGLTEEVLFWRLHFLLAAMCSMLADPHRIEVSSAGLCSAQEPGETLRQLLSWASGGFRAALPTPADLPLSPSASSPPSQGGPA